MNLRPQLPGHLDADAASEQGGDGVSSAGPCVPAKRRSFPVALRWAKGSVSMGMSMRAEALARARASGAWHYSGRDSSRRGSLDEG